MFDIEVLLIILIKSILLKHFLSVGNYKEAKDFICYFHFENLSHHQVNLHNFSTEVLWKNAS